MLVSAYGMSSALDIESKSILNGDVLATSLTKDGLDRRKSVFRKTTRLFGFSLDEQQIFIELAQVHAPQDRARLFRCFRGATAFVTSLKRS
jgi:hypothetical protein